MMPVCSACEREAGVCIAALCAHVKGAVSCQKGRCMCDPGYCMHEPGLALDQRKSCEPLDGGGSPGVTGDVTREGDDDIPSEEGLGGYTRLVALQASPMYVVLVLAGTSMIVATSIRCCLRRRAVGLAETLLD
jgi:hypothetical protein